MIRLLLFTILFLAHISSRSALGQSNISGHFVALETGDPIADATIKLKSRQGFEIPSIASVSTDSSGYFEFNKIPENTYMMEVSNVFEIENHSVLCSHTISRFKVAEQTTIIDFRASIYYCYWIASRQPWFKGKQFDKDFSELERSHIHISGKRGGIMASGAHLVDK